MSGGDLSMRWTWRSLTTKHWPTIAAIVLVAVAIRVPLLTTVAFQADSADYLRGTRYGFGTLYFNRDSVDLRQFLSNVRATGGRRVWDDLYRANDRSAIRHFHTPAAFYLNTLLPSDGARSHRAASMILGVLCCVAVYGLIAQCGSGREYALAGALAVALYQKFTIPTTDISPHPTFLLLAILELWALVAWVQVPSRRRLLLAAIPLGLSIATLELAPGLAIVAAFAVMFGRTPAPPIRERLNDAVVLAAATGAVLFVAWPGGVLAGAYVIAYGVFALVGAYGAKSSLPGQHNAITSDPIWARLFATNWLLGLLCVIGFVAGALMLVSRSRRAAAIPFLYAVVSLGLGFGHRFKNPEYGAEAVVPLMAAASIGFALLLHQLRDRTRTVAAVAVAAALVVALGIETQISIDAAYEPRADVDSVLARLPQLVPTGSKLVTNAHWEAYNAYLPGYTFEPTDGRSVVIPRRAEYGADAQYLLLDLTYLDAQVKEVLDHANVTVLARRPDGSPRIVLTTKAAFDAAQTCNNPTSVGCDTDAREHGRSGQGGDPRHATAA